MKNQENSMKVITPLLLRLFIAGCSTNQLQKSPPKAIETEKP